MDKKQNKSGFEKLNERETKEDFKYIISNCKKILGFVNKIPVVHISLFLKSIF